MADGSCCCERPPVSATGPQQNLMPVGDLRGAQFLQEWRPEMWDQLVLR